MPQALHYVTSQVIPHQVGVPIVAGQQPLHSVGPEVSGLLGQLPAVLALNGAEQPFQVIQYSPPRLGPTKPSGNAGMHGFDALGPGGYLR